MYVIYVYIDDCLQYNNEWTRMYTWLLLFVYRFSKLLEPASERRQQLEDSLKLQQFYREIEGELQWVKEHKPLADSPDYGKSLTGVQNLQKKHQVWCLLKIVFWYTTVNIHIFTCTDRMLVTAIFTHILLFLYTSHSHTMTHANLCI